MNATYFAFAFLEGATRKLEIPHVLVLSWDLTVSFLVRNCLLNSVSRICPGSHPVAPGECRDSD